MSMAIESGRVEYTSRGFNQDAEDAMRGDIVRALVEAITNSDDAYVRVSGNRRDVGKIVVEVEHRKSRPWVVRVKDRAGGIAGLKDKITKLGGRSSGFEGGHELRGHFGRGAKDLAGFGTVTFHTIVNDHYEQLVLRRDSSWSLEESRKARSTDRDKMGLRDRDSGTMVEILVEGNITCPRHQTLKDRLSRHYELRDILSGSNREVRLVNLNDGTCDVLRYEYPASETVFQGAVDIPGYDGVTAQVRIGRLPEMSDDNPSDPGRTSGLLIKGARAIYESTLFEYENDMHAAWFEGEVRCTYIDELQREYDDLFDRGEAPPAFNSFRIVTRQRDGLRRDHPFFAAMAQAVSGPLGDAIAKERERARFEDSRVESEETRQALQNASRELSRLINEELREIDAEDLPPFEEGQEPPPLLIVPESVFAYLGEDKTLTLAGNRNLFEVGTEVAVSVEPGGVVELLTTSVVLEPHKRRDDLLVGQIRIRPLTAGEMTIVNASTMEYRAEALVEVRSARTVVEEDVAPPDELQFERASYDIAWTRVRRLKIQAPAELVSVHGDSVGVVSNDPGIVVLGPVAQLKFAEDLDFYEAVVRVEGRVLGATATIMASLGESIATTGVKVTKHGEDPGLVIRLVEEDMGVFRGVIESETVSGQLRQVLKVSTKHKGLRPYFGPHGQGQNSPACRAVIAEVVADTAARHVVGRLFQQRRNQEEFDDARIYREHYRRTERILPPIQRLLLGRPEQTWESRDLEASPLLESA